MRLVSAYVDGEIIVRNLSKISNALRWPSYLRFLVIFAVLLISAYYLLFAGEWIHRRLEISMLNMEMAPVAASTLAVLANGLFSFLAMAGLFVMIEWQILRFSDFQARYREGLIFSISALSISILIHAALFGLMRSWGVTPLFYAADLGPAIVAIPFLYILLLGLMEYGLHRALHHYDFLWRFHAIHHQIENLNAARSYAHFGQDIIYLAMITVPLILLCGVQQHQIILVTCLYLLSNYYMHSDCPALSFPAPLRHIFADNVYHHQHHTRDVRHMGKNYASFFSFFDRIFGTQYMPANGDFPETGIDGYPPLASLRDYMGRPFGHHM
jgi:sterol desaturase/sphingolipid hydroxylase (fatty acid hydroxylase superfamily)